MNNINCAQNFDQNNGCFKINKTKFCRNREIILSNIKKITTTTKLVVRQKKNLNVVDTNKITKFKKMMTHIVNLIIETKKKIKKIKFSFRFFSFC